MSVSNSVKSTPLESQLKESNNNALLLALKTNFDDLDALEQILDKSLQQFN